MGTEDVTPPEGTPVATEVRAVIAIERIAGALERLAASSERNSELVTDILMRLERDVLPAIECIPQRMGDMVDRGLGKKTT